MPVAGLPVALETLLSSLLAVNEPTSWKVDGEPGSVVVVMRFQQRDSQPLLTSNRRASYRLKTPAQRRRDEKRSRQHRQKGEQKHCVTVLPCDTIVEDVAKKSVAVHDLAATSRAPKPADYVTKSTVTFDPSCSGHFEVAEAPSTDTTNASSATETPPPKDQNAKVTPTREATMEDFERMMTGVTKELSRALEDDMRVMRDDFTQKGDLMSKTSSHTRDLPSQSTSSQAPSDPQASPERTPSSDPAKSSESTRCTHRTRSAVLQRVRNTARPHRSETRTPSTRQQPPRVSRKT